LEEKYREMARQYGLLCALGGGKRGVPGEGLIRHGRKVRKNLNL
jgi:hypothetical protein